MYFTDVTLRDGLQMETKAIPIEDKFRLFEHLLSLPAQRLEITSFVNPKWIPQLADSQAFCELIFSKKDIAKGKELMAFVPNLKGLERLLAFDIPWASAFIATSETFNKKNVNADIKETVKELGELVKAARAKGRKVRLYVSTVFGCPYEGESTDGQVNAVLKQVAGLNPDEIALSDTIGVAIPDQVRRIVNEFAKHFDIKKTALHLHNTYGLALAAAEAGYQCGVRSFDGTTGGIGGCPYAKGATGNVAIEELQYLFTRMKAGATLKPAALFAATSELERIGIHVHSRLHDIMKKGGTIHAVG